MSLLNRLSPFFVIAVVLSAAWVAAGEEKAPPAEARSVSPVKTDGAPEEAASSVEEIAGLVRQLDANRFSRRQAASQKLTAAGKAAIPALTEAAAGASREATTRAIDILKTFFESPDAETKAAAKAALEKLAKSDHAAASRRAREILEPPKPPFHGPAQGGIRIGAGGIQIGRGQIQIRVGGAGPGAKSITVKNVNGVKEIEVQENGRTIKIHDDPKNGIKMEVTEKKNGKPETKKYEAKNADELKKKHPEAHKIYKHYALGKAGGIQIQQIRIQRLPARALPRPPLIPPAPKSPPAVPGARS